jgi:K(+)-stimulated pyrophosphate-energized sodium pump
MNFTAAFLPLEIQPLSPPSLMIMGVIAVIAVVSLVIAAVLARNVLAADEGTVSMKTIAAAVQEGASAYLGRQFRTLGNLSLIHI